MKWLNSHGRLKTMNEVIVLFTFVLVAGAIMYVMIGDDE